jgi:sugar-specific transcriptional regulator TrmB
MDTKKILDYLEQLDLSDMEAKLYLALLDSGPISVRDLAEITEIKRTTAYFHIDLLVEKGLVIRVVNGAKKQVSPVSPQDALQFLVEKKLESAKVAQQKLPAILTAMTTSLSQFKNVGEAEIQYYVGLNNIRKIYAEALDSGELRSYVRLEEGESILSDNSSFFNEAFKRNKDLKVREIFYNTPATKEPSLKDVSEKNNYSYKFMPKELNFTSGDTLIYNGKVAIINYKGKASSVVLHSDDYYGNSKELFDFIWKILPDMSE